MTRNNDLERRSKEGIFTLTAFGIGLALSFLGVYTMHNNLMNPDTTRNIAEHTVPYLTGLTGMFFMYSPFALLYRNL
jgi:hypothetical protein